MNADRDHVLSKTIPFGDCAALLDQIRAQAKAEGIREATDRVQRHVYDLQCPTSARGYVKGARMAHRWWEKVLGGELGRLRELADEIEEAKTHG